MLEILCILLIISNLWLLWGIGIHTSDHKGLLRRTHSSLSRKLYLRKLQRVIEALFSKSGQILMHATIYKDALSDNRQSLITCPISLINEYNLIINMIRQAWVTLYTELLCGLRHSLVLVCWFLHARGITASVCVSVTIQ